MVVSARFLAHLGFCLFATRLSVHCVHGPWVAGDVANSDGDEHQGALAVGKVVYDAGVTSDLPV